VPGREIGDAVVRRSVERWTNTARASEVADDLSLGPWRGTIKILN
jgi:hypothetical protein